MSHHNTIKKLTFNWINAWIIIASMIVFVSIIFASLTMFVKSQKAEEFYFQRVYSDSASTNSQLIATDKNGISKDSIQYGNDKIIELEARLNMLEKVNENTLSDLRQESNNVINKVNGWLGFWMSILAIFCGIMPIVIQYVLQRKTENKFNKMISDLDDKAHSHHLFNMVTSLHINRECSVISDSAKQKDLISLIVCDAYLALNHLIDKIDNFDKDLDRKTEMMLIGAIMQYCRLIDILKMLSDPRKIRNLEIIKDTLRDLIKDILDHENVSRNDIRARLIDLLPKLSGLHAVL